MISMHATTLPGDWLERVTMALDAAAIEIGAYRLSIASVLTFLCVALLIFVVARLGYRAAARVIGSNARLDASQQALAQKIIGIAIVTFAVLVAIDLLGIDLTALAFFSGGLGLAVGFGMQKTLGNLIAGLILLMDRSVKPGDVIVVGDTFGAIGKIGVRAVSVVTRDGKEHLIPNEKMMTDPVENWSYSSRDVRLHIPVGISYSADLALAQKLMLQAATAATRALKEPAPSVWLKSFGDSSVEHDILVWIRDPELGIGNVQSEILNIIWVLFKQNGIEIPYPQTDVHIRSLPQCGLVPEAAGAVSA